VFGSKVSRIDQFRELLNRSKTSRQSRQGKLFLVVKLRKLAIHCCVATLERRAPQDQSPLIRLGRGQRRRDHTGGGHWCRPLLGWLWDNSQEYEKANNSQPNAAHDQQQGHGDHDPHPARNAAPWFAQVARVMVVLV
jgi:hypothetical protein